MSNLLAIDPGNERSGWCVVSPSGKVRVHGVDPNDDLLKSIVNGELGAFNVDKLAVEMVASYGMAVGRTVFETCVWIGRFIQGWCSCWMSGSVTYVYRREVKLYLCGNTRAKDANVRQAIMDKYPRTGGGKTPEVGTKKQPGPLYGFKGDAWAALGVALTALAGEAKAWNLEHAQ